MGVALMSPLSKTLAEQDNRVRQLLRNVVEEDLKFDSDENDVPESVSSSSMPPRSQRAINFSPTVEYYDVIGLDDYSEKEFRRCWYSSEEKDKMNRNKDKLVARLEAGKPPRGDMTYQGLQCWTNAGGLLLDQSIALVVNSVMDEQDRQWAANKDDFDRLAEISATASAHSAKTALERGLEDEMEARLAWEIEEINLVSVSDHSKEAEDCRGPAVTRPELFAVPKGLTRKRSKVQSPEAQYVRSSEVAKEHEPLKSAPKKSVEARASEKSRKPLLDPPAPVNRTFSSDASEVLFLMRTVGRNMAAF
jgi:hypothetical protein